MPPIFAAGPRWICWRLRWIIFISSTYRKGGIQLHILVITIVYHFKPSHFHTFRWSFWCSVGICKNGNLGLVKSCQLCIIRIIYFPYSCCIKWKLILRLTIILLQIWELNVEDSPTINATISLQKHLDCWISFCCYLMKK